MKMPTASEYAAAVARGMALLDEKRPGWVDRIDLDALVMYDPCRCIVGQEFGAGDSEEVYAAGLETLGLGTGDEDPYGFDGWDADALKAEWHRAISERRSAR